jgi:aspartate aminotransferase
MTQLAISKRVRLMVPSATLGMAAAARELADQGIDVAILSAGEPDFDTPQEICDIAKASIDKGKTHYVPVRGTKAMISALQHKFLRDQGVAYAADEVMCTVGAKAALMMAMMAILEEGDEVILCAPFWVSYREQVNLLGAKPVIITCKAEDNFMPTGESLRSALSSKTKAIIINSPNNPSGGVISKSQLEELALAVKDTNIWIVSDEIYEKLLFGNAVHYSPAALSDDMRERTLVISGASKGYAMTGWRVGFVAGNKNIIKAMGNLQGQETTCLPEFIQDAASFAMLEDANLRAKINSMGKAYAERKALFIRLFKQMPLVKIFEPQGAFYIWADFSAYINKEVGEKIIKDDIDLATRMLKEAHVACVPGTPFGISGYLRFSIASAPSEIEKAAVRISQWLK